MNRTIDRSVKVSVRPEEARRAVSKGEAERKCEGIEHHFRQIPSYFRIPPTLRDASLQSAPQDERDLASRCWMSSLAKRKEQ